MRIASRQIALFEAHLRTAFMRAHFGDRIERRIMTSQCVMEGVHNTALDIAVKACRPCFGESRAASCR